jgi:hypothetical protein
MTTLFPQCKIISTCNTPVGICHRCGELRARQDVCLVLTRLIILVCCTHCSRNGGCCGSARLVRVPKVLERSRCTCWSSSPDVPRLLHERVASSRSVQMPG